MDLYTICSALKSVQRDREMVMKSRIMIENRLTAIVASGMGYSAGLTKAKRRAMFRDAKKKIPQIIADDSEHDLKTICLAHMDSIQALRALQRGYESNMKEFVGQLPVACWLNQATQRGLGEIGLATIIGEAGSLTPAGEFIGYANAAKLWKRFGLAPIVYDGKSKMGSTWKKGKEGKLPAEIWTSAGYSPRRRSIAYRVADPLMKGNASGPYRALYLEKKKEAYRTHPEWGWKKCTKCNGKKGSRDCKCGGLGKQCLRADRHAKTIMTKRLLLHLWVAWHDALGVNPRRTAT